MTIMSDSLSKIELLQITKRFETGTALHDITFSVEPGERIALLGPSGAGKSLTLRLIAGLEKPTTGTVQIDGRPMNALRRFFAPSRRGTGLVTQDMPLHPQKDALAFVRSGFRGKKISSEDRNRYIRDMMERLEVAGKERRLPHQLSGGERGRFALIRALAPGNRILLLDEPLSALDPHQREEMIDLIRTLHDEMSLTTIYVTHYIEEAQSLCDRVILLCNGRIIQQGTWTDLKYKPVEPFARDYLTMTTRFHIAR
ncbi:MAG TPA: ATP-binding cassette domain-containing protein [bacterium]|nr:ATP-binding cassette domain-containing protein [bacterium]HQL61998.1 ATP-binding cassette domain-containing protein [bacterium]